jgi:hypothetical protein
MRRSIWIALFIVLGLLSAFAADADTAWVLYTHPDKLLSVRFPGKPRESLQQGQSEYGATRTKVATFIDGDHALVVTGGIYDGTTKVDVKVMLDRAAQSVGDRFRNTRIIAQKAITLDGLQGREVQFEAPGPYNKPLRGIARVYAAAQPPSSYLVMALQMDGKPDPNAQKFLDSLHLGSKVEVK